jgi:predicted cupin superfamily sugar epimerase
MPSSATLSKQDFSADDIIRLLDLQPHPEGGHFRETFRDLSPKGQRPASTAIYFLLRAGEVSRWHAVDASEAWHYYAGAPLLLEIAAPGARADAVHVGNNLAAGERPQAVVPTGHWQRAQSLGAWTLAGCTVAPGFDFAGFQIAPDGFEPGHPE